MSDTIHNLKVVREALEAEGLTVHVKLIDQAIEDISAAPQAVRDALEECLGQMGWTNYTDDELRHEANLGNGKAPIILRARAALSRSQAESAWQTREAIVKECAEAARDGFEAAMKNYVLTGPGGMAMQMINSIKALSRPVWKPSETTDGDQ